MRSWPAMMGLLTQSAYELPDLAHAGKDASGQPRPNVEQVRAWIERHSKPGETILIHAAAGGVGLIVCQWAKHLGATVIGTVGDDEKAALAKANGCDHPINYRREDFVARVNQIDKIDAFDHTAFFDIQTGDNTFGEHRVTR